jgi:hypothetical protein
VVCNKQTCGLQSVTHSKRVLSYPNMTSPLACTTPPTSIDELAAQVQGCLRNSTSDVYRYLQPIQGEQGQVGLASMKLVNTTPPSFLSSPTPSLTRTLTSYLQSHLQAPSHLKTQFSELTHSSIMAASLVNTLTASGGSESAGGKQCM